MQKLRFIIRQYDEHWDRISWEGEATYEGADSREIYATFALDYPTSAGYSIVRTEDLTPQVALAFSAPNVTMGRWSNDA